MYMFHEKCTLKSYFFSIKLHSQPGRKNDGISYATMPNTCMSFSKSSISSVPVATGSVGSFDQRFSFDSTVSSRKLSRHTSTGMLCSPDTCLLSYNKERVNTRIDTSLLWPSLSERVRVTLYTHSHPHATPTEKEKKSSIPVGRVFSDLFSIFVFHPNIVY